MTSPTAPLVSVIVSFLNEERFLSEAVESVLLQDYPLWELILVDDGSTDHSSEIAQNFAALHPGQIRYLEHAGHSNKGLSASRNLGVSSAKGEILAVLDADDVWLSNKLSRQIAIMQRHPEVGMLCEASLYWRSWEPTGEQDEVILVGERQDMVFDPPELLSVLYPLSSFPAPCPCGLMIRTDAFRSLGGFEEHFRGKYQLYEDQAFLHKMYLNYPVYISSQYNNKYRQRIGSLVQKISEEGKYHQVRKYFLEWLESYLREKKFQDANIHALLQAALYPYHHPKMARVKGWGRKIMATLKRTSPGSSH
jgi:glycosyltransferase involved in cell wall biosynthesis